MIDSLKAMAESVAAQKITSTAVGGLGVSESLWGYIGAIDPYLGFFTKLFSGIYMALAAYGMVSRMFKGGKK